MFRPRIILLTCALASALFSQTDPTLLDVQTSESPFIGGVWVGNVTPTSATVSIRLNSSGQRVRLQVSRSESLLPATFSSVVTTAATSGDTVKLTVQGLVPDTDYFYGIEVAGVLRPEPASRGRFHSFPLGRASFRIAFGSCGDFRAANQSAFPAIIAERPLAFIHTGDLHYSDTNSKVADEYRYNYDNVLGHVAQGPLFRSMPVIYMWDDHDFSGNDSDTNAVGRDTARSVYRERVPSYPLGAVGGTVAQAFTIGRVRFIMTDLRSAAVATTTRESASKTKMGASQKAWFKQELINARDNSFPLIVWVCPDPWIGPARVGSEDGWGAYATERTEIANFIRDNRISNVTIMSGDMHALAYDDGTNSDYATGGGAPMTVLQAAALTADGSIKGGPYSGGAIPGSPHYGVLEIYDNGGPSVACRFLGMHATEGRKLVHIFSSSLSGAKDHSIVNISTLARVTSGADALVSGFVISGTTNRTVLVRAIGPTLAAFGVTDALAQPQLSVYQGDRLIAANAGWSGLERASASTLTDAFDRAGAFRLVDEGSRDAALIVSLPPGAYTVQVKSGNNTAGAALLEVYELN
jgi:phosphodiesterase/alkaline phosphatase D-like protein